MMGRVLPDPRSLKSLLQWHTYTLLCLSTLSKSLTLLFTFTRTFSHTVQHTCLDNTALHSLHWDQFTCRWQLPTKGRKTLTFPLLLSLSTLASFLRARGSAARNGQTKVEGVQLTPLHYDKLALSGEHRTKEWKSKMQRLKSTMTTSVFGVEKTQAYLRRSFQAHGDPYCWHKMCSPYLKQKLSIFPCPVLSVK